MSAKKLQSSLPNQYNILINNKNMKGNTYTITGTKFEGTITFTYDLSGWIINFSVDEAELSDEQRKWLFTRFPFVEHQIKTFETTPNFQIEKGEPDLSFEAFWNVYGIKQKRIVTEKLWNKLSKSDRMAAIQAVRKYNNWLARQNGIAKQLPDTFIRQKRWLDDFNQ